MKAKELRKGNIFNWINRTGYVHIPDNKPLEVIAIGVFSVESISQGLNLANLQNSLTIKLSDMSPIPLTEEWLIKFGFELQYPDSNHPFYILRYSKTQFFTISRSSMVLNNGLDGYGITNRFEHIKYVHQLQNLYFALTGEELVIKE